MFFKKIVNMTLEMYPLLIFVWLTAIDLVKKMLTVDTNKRITLTEALNHLWLKVGTSKEFITTYFHIRTVIECDLIPIFANV